MRLVPSSGWTREILPLMSKVLVNVKNEKLGIDKRPSLVGHLSFVGITDDSNRSQVYLLLRLSLVSPFPPPSTDRVYTSRDNTLE